MKKIHFLTILGLASTVAFVQAQTTSYSEIVGYSKVSVPSGTRAVVPGFVKAAVFSGAGAVSGQTVVSSGLTANALKPTEFSSGAPNFPTHYLEITAGTYEGYSFDVLSNTASGVTVSGLPTALNGTTISYVIRPHLTLGDIDSSGLPDGSVVLNIFNNPTVAASSYLYDSGGNWYDGSGSFLMNHAVIYPGTGVSLNNSSGQFEVSFTGVVKANKTAIPVYQNATQNLVGPMNPSTSTSLTEWANPLPADTVANVLTTIGDNNVSLTLLTDLGSTTLYDGGGNPIPSVSLQGQNAFSMSAMSQDGYVIFKSPLQP
ncbi:MAG: hypothetical protein RLZZ112_707 [Verrucomicrobiota bacterium]|jgi:hypothetical protein